MFGQCLDQKSPRVPEHREQLLVKSGPSTHRLLGEPGPSHWGQGRTPSRGPVPLQCLPTLCRRAAAKGWGTCSVNEGSVTNLEASGTGNTQPDTEAHGPAASAYFTLQTFWWKDSVISLLQKRKLRPSDWHLITQLMRDEASAQAQVGLASATALYCTFRNLPDLCMSGKCVFGTYLPSFGGQVGITSLQPITAWGYAIGLNIGLYT